MKILIVEDFKDHSEMVENFVKNSFSKIANKALPEIFKGSFTTILKDNRKDAEEYIDSLGEDEKKNLLLAFVDLRIPEDKNSSDSEEKNGISILKKMKENSIPSVILSQYLETDETFDKILNEFGSFSTFKDKDSFIPSLEKETLKKSEAQSLLIFAMNAHPVLNTALELKKCIPEDFKNLFEIAKEVADYLKKPPTLQKQEEQKTDFKKKKESDNISTGNLKVEVKNEFAPLRAVIIHTPGKEMQDIKPSECKDFLLDQPLNYDTLENQYEEFKKKFPKDTQLLEARDLLKEVLDLSPDNQAKFALEIVRAEKLDPHFFPELCRTPIDELIALAIEGRRDREGRWIFAPIPNLMFTRDWGFVVHDKIFVFNTDKPARKKEKIIGEFIFQYHPLFKKNKNFIPLQLEKYETIEGGDVVLLNEEIVLVGISDRTTLPAIRKLAEVLIKPEEKKKEVKVRKVIATQAPLLLERGMHLDTYLAIIGENEFLAYTNPLEKEDQVFYIFDQKSFEDNNNMPALRFGKFQDVLSEVSGVHWNPIWVKNEKEFWEDACNVVSLAPGEMVIYERAKETIDALQIENFNPIKLDGYELVFARGGPHCMTQPILREGE